MHTTFGKFETERKTYTKSLTIYVVSEFIRVFGNDLVFSVVLVSYALTLTRVPILWEIFGWVTYGASWAYFVRMLIVILAKLIAIFWR